MSRWQRWELRVAVADGVDDAVVRAILHRAVVRAVAEIEALGGLVASDSGSPSQHHEKDETSV